MDKKILIQHKISFRSILSDYAVFIFAEILPVM